MKGSGWSSRDWGGCRVEVLEESRVVVWGSCMVE